MRVLQVATDTDRRGAQVFAAELAAILMERGFDVRTVALAPGFGRSALPFEVLGRRRLGPATLRSLRSAIRSSDVVVGFGSTTLPACAVASAFTGVPFVYRSIGDLRYWAPTPAKRLRVSRSLARAAAVVALWPGAADTLVGEFGVDAARVHVIPRGVDPASFTTIEHEERPALRRRLGLPQHAPIAAVVGSLAPEKAVPDAIRVAEAIPVLHLAIAGTGPLEPELRREAEVRAPGRVHFLGDLADPRPVYGAADLLLLASLSEGVPGVVIEAGMCGRPAAATDVGGTASVIEDGVTGRLAPPADPAKLTSAVEAVLREARHLGGAARDSYVARFSLPRIGDQWADLLRSTIAT